MFLKQLVYLNFSISYYYTKKCNLFLVRCFVPSNMLNLLPNSSHISIYSLGFSVCTSLSSKNNGRVDFLSYVFLILALLCCLEPHMLSESGRYRHLCLIPNIKKMLLPLAHYIIGPFHQFRKVSSSPNLLRSF